MSHVEQVEAAVRNSLLYRERSGGGNAGTYSQFWDLYIAIPITMHNELIVRIRGIFDAMRDGITDLFKTPSPSPGCEVLVVWCVE